MTGYRVPLIIRGEIIESGETEFGGRDPATRFRGPDVFDHLGKLPLSPPSAIADLHALPFEEILDYLVELGAWLDFGKNAHLQEALALTCKTSGLGEPILRSVYKNLGKVFDRAEMRQMADILIGIPFLEGWVRTRSEGASTSYVRAFGARALHVIAGNVPTISAITVMRNAIVRSDMIVKTPSNDPLTAAAIARTMIDMAPDHPITRHISVGYWKGGDERIESRLYQPAAVEKIVAWGGLASVRHISKYLQPGIDLITLDPKLSATIIGREAFADEATMRTCARRAALDVAVNNQQACLNARVIHVETGTDAAGLARANRFGELLYEAIQLLPVTLSNPVAALDPALAEEMEGLRFASALYRRIGGDGRGGVIVSQMDEPVEFSRLLSGRVANLVPVDSLDAAIGAVTAWTQTIGLYPDRLMHEIRDRLAIQGAQRLVTLGCATRRTIAGPQDGIEVLRRMCKWILNEVHSDDPTAIWPDRQQPAAAA
ncbi:acyl-CoA reductase [Flavisphingomonas formosensis]|uniref:acyl-CoA reductase n=1 Tax=Flavisphingomonas formosensis TaxID=861534 RepID=UPI0012F7BA9F|nr:acyl-CoA reductase [Sphingomonas formosensis]